MKVRNIFLIFIFIFLYIQSSESQSRVRSRRTQDVVQTRGLIETVSKVAKQTIKLIQCVISCFVKHLSLNLCNNLFPCLYDCAIGEQYVPSEIAQQIDKASKGYPSGISLKAVFGIFKCYYDCIVDRPIRDWESFAAALYCMVDSCICYQLFGVNSSG